MNHLLGKSYAHGLVNLEPLFHVVVSHLVQYCRICCVSVSSYDIGPDIHKGRCILHPLLSLEFEVSLSLACEASERTCMTRALQHSNGRRKP